MEGSMNPRRRRKPAAKAAPIINKNGAINPTWLAYFAAIIAAIA